MTVKYELQQAHQVERCQDHRYQNASSSFDFVDEKINDESNCACALTIIIKRRMSNSFSFAMSEFLDTEAQVEVYISDETPI